MVRLQPKGRDLTNALRVLALGVAMLLCAPAGAQLVARVDSLAESALPDGARPGVSLRFGFANTLVADAWSPVRVSLLGGDEPLSGVVSVEYANMRGAPMRVLAPFAVAPGQTTHVDLALPLTNWLGKLHIRIENERGRALRNFEFEDWSDIGVGGAPSVLPSEATLVGAIGAPSLEVASREWLRIRTEALAERTRRSGEEADDAPSAPIIPPNLTGQANFVQLSPDDLPPLPTAYQTLGALVLGGDSLQLLARPVVESIRQWVLGGGRLVLMLDRPGPGFERYLPAGALDVAQTPALQESGRTGRALSLAPDELARSWQLSTIGGVAVADGPVGLGWVVVIGADPAPEIAEQGEIAAAWNEALAPLIGARLERAGEEGDDDYFWWRGAPAQLGALLDVLADDLDNVTAVGFWPMLLVLFGLATLLGPVDYFVLKRRNALHRSWLTALGWIGLFTALGAVGPKLMRSDETQIRRVRAIDISQPDGAAVSSGVLGVFAGAGGGVELSGIDPASRWRPTQVFGASAFGAALDLHRTPAGGVVPGPLPLRRWSFLTLIDESEATTSVRADVRRDSSGAMQVRLTGVEGAIRGGSLLTADGWRELSFGEPIDQTVVGIVGELIEGAPHEWMPIRPRRRQPWDPFDGRTYRYTPGLASGLPGIDDRGDLLMERVMRGGVGLVCLDVEGMTPDVTAASVDNASQRTIYRILAPIEEGEIEPRLEGAT